MNNNDKEGERWLKQSQYDLKVAVWNMEGKFYADACFKAQQACEKALKAFCYFNGERKVLGHSTRDLLEKCSRYNQAFSSLMKNCTKLDKYYITARYPNGLPSGIPNEYFDREEAEEAIRLAEEVLFFVEKTMKKA